MKDFKGQIPVIVKQKVVYWEILVALFTILMLGFFLGTSFSAILFVVRGCHCG